MARDFAALFGAASGTDRIVGAGKIHFGHIGSDIGYIRVSTVKQGEHGSSLQEQRDAIASFATRHGFTISEWFEEDWPARDPAPHPLKSE